MPRLAEKQQQRYQPFLIQDERKVLNSLRRKYPSSDSHFNLKTSQHRFKKDIDFINELHGYRRRAKVEFDTLKENSELKINYDFVLDVYNFVKRRRSGSFDEAEFKEGIKNNLITNSFERHGAEESSFNYYILNGRLYSDRFNDPFVGIIQFGIDYLNTPQSQTHLLETQERIGYERLEQLALNEENNQVIFLLSPPYKKKYPEKYSDGFLLEINDQTKERVLKGIRFKKDDLTDRDYYKIATELDSHFFDELPKFIIEHKEEYEKDSDLVLKAYYRGKPIKVSSNFGKTPKEVFEKVVGKIDREKQKENQAIITATMSFILAYINILCNVSSEAFYQSSNYWISLGLAFQSILSFSKYFLREYQNEEKKDDIEGIALRVRRNHNINHFAGKIKSGLENYSNYQGAPLLNNLALVSDAQQAQHSNRIPVDILETDIWGKVRVEEEQVGCSGSSVGLKFGEEGENNDIGKVSSIFRRMSTNRIETKFKLLKKENSQNIITKWYECSECEWQANGPIGNVDACPNCGFTKKKYEEKYGELCA